MKCKFWWLSLLYCVTSWDCENEEYGLPNLKDLGNDWPFVAGTKGTVPIFSGSKNDKILKIHQL